MNAEIEREREVVIREWEQRAGEDLESAEVIMRETNNFDIAAYHAHQAIEKTIKAELLKTGASFKYIHDLVTLFQQFKGKTIQQEIMRKISYVNTLYPILRYPTGDRITREQAEKCVATAKEVFLLFGKS